MTFYLKYRPQTISGLDLVSVRKELSSILTSGRFAHAYLFAGPRGTGKTSAARILAKIVNCKKNVTKHQAAGTRRLNEPCNVCVSCKEITQGTALDIFEIDAASNRGIDDIRELRERIKLAPAQNRYKVYIIDEVHMLTTEAFNALLKTLEEPPAHALFVLCTTEPERLPQTVISRCTRIPFPKASTEEVVSSLAKAVRGEKLLVEPGALQALAESVDGSFRDGMKYLEQLSLHAHTPRKRITLEDVRVVTGSGRQESVRRLLLALAKRDTALALGELARVVEEEVSLENYLREILEKLRLLLLSEIGVVKEEKIEGLDISSIRLLIVLFSKAAVGLRTAVVPQLPLEIAVVEWIDTSGGQAVASSELKTGTRVSPQAVILPEAKGSSPKVTGKPLRMAFSKVLELWPKVLETLRPKNHSLEALLKAAKPLEITDEQLVVEVAYPFHKQQLEVMRYRTMVEGAIAEVFSGRLGLRYVLRTPQKVVDPATRKQHENISGSVEDEEIVRVAEEIFGGKEGE